MPGSGCNAHAGCADTHGGTCCRGSGSRCGEGVPGILCRRTAAYPRLHSVLPDVAFCPTGGIEPGNVAAYLAAGAASVGMGGALVDERRIAAGDRPAIEAAARQVVAAS